MVWGAVINMVSSIKSQINSVFVHVSDLKKSAEWYSKLLGLKVQQDRFNGGPVYWMELDGYTGLILDDNSVNKKREGWRNSLAPQFMVLSNKVEEAYEQIRRERIPITRELESPHEGLTFFNFQDPEGNVIMVCSADDNTPPLEKIQPSPIHNKITAVFIHVTELQKATNWYSSLLGFPSAKVESDETIFEVSNEKGADILLDCNRYINGEDYKTLFMFETNDIDAAFSYVKSNHIEVFTEIERPGPVSFFTVSDLDENVIMICESHE